MTVVPAGRRKKGCLSNLDLDELLSGDLAGRAREAELRLHIDGCTICGPRLAARQAEPALSPDPLVFRPLLSSLAASRRGRVRRRWLGLAGALGTAAVAGVIVWGHRSGGPAENSGDRTKGALILTIHVKSPPANGQPSAVAVVRAEGTLRAGDEMRFTLTAAQPGFAAILGLDGTPLVTTYVPVAGAVVRPVPIDARGPVTLPGSVIADDTLGFERIVAVVCPTVTSPEALREKARAALERVGGRPEAVASLGTGCSESSVLLHKTAP